MSTETVRVQTRISKSIRLDPEESLHDLTQAIRNAADDMIKGWIWPVDIGDGWVVFEVETYDGECWEWNNYRHSWSRSKGKITVKDDGERVKAVTRWISDPETEE